MGEQKKKPYLGFGLGLRSPHYPYILEKRPRVDWFEAITENYLGLHAKPQGRPLHYLTQIRKNYPIVLHGVSLSIGSVDELDRVYLKALRNLNTLIEPAWISDHLCWTGVHSENLHDLLPLPFTEEALELVVRKIAQTQAVLGQRILIENVSSYVTFTHSTIAEWDFLTETAQRADCGILLDINNIYVNSINHGFDPSQYLRKIPRDRVWQFHLAGHTNCGNHLIDTHDKPVCKKVWKLYEEAVGRFGKVSTLLERDDNIPEFPKLLLELRKAQKQQEKILGYPSKTFPRSTPALDALGDCRP